MQGLSNREFHCTWFLLQASGKVVSLAEVPGVLTRLTSMTAQLDACQRALSEFLEEKRTAFPRYRLRDMIQVDASMATPAGGCMAVGMVILKLHYVGRRNQELLGWLRPIINTCEWCSANTGSTSWVMMTCWRY